MDSIFQFKIAIYGIVPQIWRRALVPSNFTLPKLHIVIQAVMDWHGYHLHSFEIKGERYDMYDEGFLDMDSNNEEEAGPIADLIDTPKTKILYTYDFGDNWEHIVTLEKILPYDPKITYPICTGGKRAAPPEDCGGTWGYLNFVEAMQNPEHPEYKDYKEWYGKKFDPEAFDLTKINTRLHRIDFTMITSSRSS